MENERSKYWETMVSILETQFPKGKCKERGQALVFLAYIEMMLQGKEFTEDGLLKSYANGSFTESAVAKRQTLVPSTIA